MQVEGFEEFVQNRAAQKKEFEEFAAYTRICLKTLYPSDFVTLLALSKLPDGSHFRQGELAEKLGTYRQNVHRCLYHIKKHGFADFSGCGRRGTELHWVKRSLKDFTEKKHG
jgi:DNA-binding MarR family transcriptional regulator